MIDTSKPKELALTPVALRTLKSLRSMRDNILEESSGGLFKDVESREWKELPIEWRMLFLLLGGVGKEDDVDALLAARLKPLATRNWREIPVPERQAIKSIIRTGRDRVLKLSMLASHI